MRRGKDMSLSYKWRRFSISLEDYRKIMELTEENEIKRTKDNKNTIAETILVDNFKPR